MSDLTERLAAKLAEDWREDFALSVASWAPQLLRLLLSEPELVASLPESVRRSVLTPRERAVLEAAKAYEDAIAEFEHTLAALQESPRE